MSKKTSDETLIEELLGDGKIKKKRADKAKAKDKKKRKKDPAVNTRAANGISKTVAKCVLDDNCEESKDDDFVPVG